MKDRLRRPKTKTRTCAHCKRRRPRLKIEWHPGIEEWQCSDFTSCDAAIEKQPGTYVTRLMIAWRKGA